MLPLGGAVRERGVVGAEEDRDERVWSFVVVVFVVVVFVVVVFVVVVFVVVVCSSSSSSSRKGRVSVRVEDLRDQGEGPLGVVAAESSQDDVGLRERKGFEFLSFVLKSSFFYFFIYAVIFLRKRPVQVALSLLPLSPPLLPHLPGVRVGQPGPPPALGEHCCVIESPKSTKRLRRRGRGGGRAAASVEDDELLLLLRIPLLRVRLCFSLSLGRHPC